MERKRFEEIREAVSRRCIGETVPDANGQQQAKM